MTGDQFSDQSRRESRKRRRLSERRRVFGRLGRSGSQRHVSGSLDEHKPSTGAKTGDELGSSRSESPSLTDSGKISMKIQFHITVAPEDEPIMFSSNNSDILTRKKSSESIGDQIHEKLSRQSSSSSRRRQQLVSMHQHSALCKQDGKHRASLQCELEPSTVHSEDNLASCRYSGEQVDSLGRSSLRAQAEPLGREQGQRSSTITDGMSDEATMRFLARHQARLAPGRQSSSSSVGQQLMRHSREHIYYKRDGQRFGHEFTLKLAVDKTYRCMLKVRPLIPIQSISIQGHQVLFADCSRANSQAATQNGNSARRSWQNIHLQNVSSPYQDQTHHQNQNQKQASTTRQNHRLSHAHTTSNLADQQHQQVLRYFAASHCSSSNSHLGNQLIYMFDWSGKLFEVNKNKNRTQVQTVLKFKNGQIISLPLQVKFYLPQCRQHLEWGSQLHFIDYDCIIDNMGQINVDRVHYY